MAIVVLYCTQSTTHLRRGKELDTNCRSSQQSIYRIGALKVEHWIAVQAIWESGSLPEFAGPMIQLSPSQDKFFPGVKPPAVSRAERFAVTGLPQSHSHIVVLLQLCVSTLPRQSCY